MIIIFFFLPSPKVDDATASITMNIEMIKDNFIFVDDDQMGEN